MPGKKLIDIAFISQLVPVLCAGTSGRRLRLPSISHTPDVHNRKVFLTLILPIIAIIFLLLLSPAIQPRETPVSNKAANVAADSIAAENSAKPLQDSILNNKPDIPWSLTFGKIFWTLIVILTSILIIRYVTRLLEAIAERWAHLRLLIKRLIPIYRVLTWTFVIFVISQGIIRPPIATLLAITASAGIALGFASQDILKNVFGGIMILLDRPFQVGDKIQVGSFYGEVVQIGLRTVRVVTPDDNLVSIPNGEIMNQSVANANAGESNCQVVAEFYFPADLDLVKARKIAYRAAAVSRYVYLNKPIAVIFKNEIHQGRSMIKMRLKAYVLDLRYEFAFMSEMTEIVIREFLKAGLITPEQMAMVKAT